MCPSTVEQQTQTQQLHSFQTCQIIIRNSISNYYIMRYVCTKQSIRNDTLKTTVICSKFIYVSISLHLSNLIHQFYAKIG